MNSSIRTEDQLGNEIKSINGRGPKWTFTVLMRGWNLEFNFAPSNKVHERSSAAQSQTLSCSSSKCCRIKRTVGTAGVTRWWVNPGTRREGPKTRAVLSYNARLPAVTYSAGDRSLSNRLRKTFVAEICVILVSVPIMSRRAEQALETNAWGRATSSVAKGSCCCEWCFPRGSLVYISFSNSSKSPSITFGKDGSRRCLFWLNSWRGCRHWTFCFETEAEVNFQISSESPCRT